jgi:hypothetical protein
MKLCPNRAPIEARDRDGRAILLVPLANSSHEARILPEDYQALVAQGVSPHWCLNGAVKVAAWPRNVQRVARLIMAPHGDVQVRHRDGDRLNLRRDNLVLRPFKRHKPPHRRASSA